MGKLKMLDIDITKKKRYNNFVSLEELIVETKNNYLYIRKIAFKNVVKESKYGRRKLTGKIF